MTRAELYDLVWSKPMTEIARQYGIRDRMWRGHAMRMRSLSRVPAIGARGRRHVRPWPTASGEKNRRSSRQHFVSAIASLASASLFAVFTYIKPYRIDVSGLSTATVTWVQLLFGAGMTIGNIIGGRLEADADV